MRFIATYLGGAERLMFSTDFPWVEPPILFAHVKEAFPDPQDQERIFSGTAKKLLGL